MIGGGTPRNGLALLAGLCLLAGCGGGMPSFLGREGSTDGVYNLRGEPLPEPRNLFLRQAAAEPALHGVILRVVGEAPTQGLVGRRAPAARRRRAGRRRDRQLRARRDPAADGAGGRPGPHPHAFRRGVLPEPGARGPARLPRRRRRGGADRAAPVTPRLVQTIPPLRPRPPAAARPPRRDSRSGGRRHRVDRGALLVAGHGEDRLDVGAERRLQRRRRHQRVVRLLEAVERRAVDQQRLGVGALRSPSRSPSGSRSGR